MPKIGRTSFILIPLTLCFWERGNSYVLFLYGLTVLLQPGLYGRFRQALRNPLVLSFLLLYSLAALSLLWSADLGRGGFILEKKAALCALPLLLAMDGQLNRQLIREAMASLVAACVLSLWIALGHAAWLYSGSGDTSVFFYHKLGWIFDELNAVYYSLYVFMSIVFFDHLIRERAFPWLSSGRLRAVVWIALGLGIILLSSRLFIALALVYGLAALAGKWRSSGKWALAGLLAAFGLMAFVLNRGRFQDLLDSRFEVLRQETFRWDTSFNGITLRLLLLKFGWLALQENHAAVQGLGVGDVRQAMNDYVLRHNLYHGNPELGDTGYLDYSLHNQYMETWLQAGLPALAAWLWLLAYSWRQGMKAGWRFPLLWLVAAVAALALFESVLERQRGVVFIAFFLSTLYSNRKHENPEIPNGGTDAQAG